MQSPPEEQNLLPMQRETQRMRAVWGGSTFSPGFPGGSDDIEPACDAGGLGWIPGSARSPGEGNGYLFPFSCLENSMDRGTSQAIVHGVPKSQTWLSDQHTHTHTHTLPRSVWSTPVFLWASLCWPLLKCTYSSFVVVAIQLLRPSCLFVTRELQVPGSPMLHCLPEFAQIHVHWVSDAI